MGCCLYTSFAGNWHKVGAKCTAMAQALQAIDWREVAQTGTGMSFKNMLGLSKFNTLSTAV
eukprot:SAG31_NODE_8545_length_1432_cov_1.476369_2_plen_61_part_00